MYRRFQMAFVPLFSQTISTFWFNVIFPFRLFSTNGHWFCPFHLIACINKQVSIHETIHYKIAQTISSWCHIAMNVSSHSSNVTNACASPKINNDFLWMRKEKNCFCSIFFRWNLRRKKLAIVQHCPIRYTALNCAMHDESGRW